MTEEKEEILEREKTNFGVFLNSSCKQSFEMTLQQHHFVPHWTKKNYRKAKKSIIKRRTRKARVIVKKDNDI